MIDVIIPAYNAHYKIVKTLLSICLQNIKNKLNVYIVDDCSDKNYDEIVEIFRTKINVKQLKLDKNSGPGVARQYGIDHSNGEYIVFIDSDDVFVDCFSLENLYNSIIGDNYDMAVGVMIDEIAENNYCEYYNHQGCLHGKLYKREFLEKNNIFFNETRSSEDNGFNRLYLLANPKIIHVNDYIYLYRYNQSSITQSDTVNYQFYSVEWFIYNMVWAAENAEVRGFNKINIAKHIVLAYFYVYYVYLNNYNRSDSTLVLLWSKPIHNLYLKYNNLLTEVEKYELFCEYECRVLPKLSFMEFIHQVELHNY